MNKDKYFCRVCDFEFTDIFDFGNMPIANNLVSTSNNKNILNEYKYNMKVGVCINCSSLQVVNVPKKELMFNEKYAYFASQSEYMKLHFAKLAEKLMQQMKKGNDLILEIGSNDGIFLDTFAKNGFKHLGVDASNNVVQISQSNGINSICRFFNEETADEILNSFGKAKIIVITNTMHHIENCQSVARGIEKILENDGILIIEDPYLLDMYEIGSIEQVYAEHNFIWSLHSYKYLFERFGINLYDVEHFKTHGGSMRYFFSKKAINSSEEMIKYLNLEIKNKIFDVNTFLDFQKNCDQICKDLHDFVSTKIKDGKTVAGYGATAKSATTLNYSKINNKMINCIYDSTPFKIGKYTPGTHIKIKNADQFSNDNPDYTVLFAWNHKDEIMRKEKKKNSKTIWVEYIPKLKLTNAN